METLPELTPTELGRALARSSQGDYRVSDLLDAWQRLSPAYRPRIETSAQLRDLVKNGMFERMLRHEVDRRRLSEYPDVAGPLMEERGRFAVSHFVESQVTSKIEHDSLTLLRYFEAHRPDWMLPTRVRVIRLIVSNRAEAGRAVLQLRDPAIADTLAARGERHGMHYRLDIGAEDDSALFAAAMKAGSGAVLGPERRNDEWMVARVMDIRPGRPYHFQEVRSDVEYQWLAVEGERRLETLCKQLRKHMRVIINGGALGAMCDRLDAGAAHP